MMKRILSALISFVLIFSFCCSFAELNEEELYIEDWVIGEEDDDSKIIFDAVIEIYKRYVNDSPIRNIGIYYGGLVPASHQQLSLFEDDKKQTNRHNLQKAVDKLHIKYGNNSVLRASSLLEESTIKERNEYIGGHKK